METTPGFFVACESRSTLNLYAPTINLLLETLRSCSISVSPSRVISFKRGTCAYTCASYSTSWVDLTRETSVDPLYSVTKWRAVKFSRFPPKHFTRVLKRENGRASAEERKTSRTRSLIPTCPSKLSTVDVTAAPRFTIYTHSHLICTDCQTTVSPTPISHGYISQLVKSVEQILMQETNAMPR